MAVTGDKCFLASETWIVLLELLYFLFQSWFTPVGEILKMQTW